MTNSNTPDSQTPGTSKSVITLSVLKDIYQPIALSLTSVKTLQAVQKATLKNALSQANWDTRILWDIYNLIIALPNQVIDAGFDPDLIPAPPLRIIDIVLPNNLPASQEKNFVPTISITIMNPDDEVVVALKIIPGILGSPASHYWRTTAPLETIVDPLRQLVSKHKVIVTPGAVAYLKTAKTTEVSKDVKPAIGIVSVGNKGRIQISFYKSEPSVADQLKRVSGLKWDADAMAYLAPASKLKEVVAIAKQYNISLAPSAKTAVEAHTAPLQYDGTFDGLRGVPITDLVSVDTAKAKRLAEFGIETVWDLLNLIPRRYLDRSSPTRIRDLKVDEEVGILATISHITVDQRRRMLRIGLTDGSGKIDLVYFNAVWQAKRFRVGDEVVAYGKVTQWVASTGRSVLSLSNPMLDPLGESTLAVIPIYPQSAKSRVTTSDINFAAIEALTRLNELVDSVPQSVRDNLELMPRTDALRAVHLPTSLPDAEKGRRRLAFDELFRMQLALLSLKAQEEEELGITHNPTGILTDALLAGLPFELTGAQKRVIAQIKTGMMRPTSSRIITQGDVGSGKSMVGIVSILSAIEGGYQAAMLAPTNLLATQLFLETKERTEGILLNGEPIRVEFFDNKLKGKRRKEVLADLASGNIHIAVGTHALLVPDIEFKNLGLVVTDEQHKFGTLQRSILPETKGPIRIIDGVKKRVRPDSLLMTATPIPRSASMVFFGDLEMAIINELPKGRIPIKTEFINSEIDLSDPNATPWKEIRSQAEKGFQSYVICALVEDNEKLELASVKETYESLSNGALSELRVAMVYGQQDAEERKAIMDSYKKGEVDVLLGSTVLEVGISNPRSTIIVILDPSRYGLAQSHQLRGRVGRSKFASYCYLYGKAVSSDSVERMKALVESNDGFYLSEVDLALRGHGHVFGESQSGASDLRVADLFLDKELIILAREAALEIIQDDPRLERRPGLKSEVTNMLGIGAEEWLVKS